MSRLDRAMEAARNAGAAHVETAVRLADEMVEDPTSIDLPRLVEAHERATYARDYARAVAEVEVADAAWRREAYRRAWNAS